MADQERALAEEILADAKRRAERIRQRSEREAQSILRQAAQEGEDARCKAEEVARARAEREKAVNEARIEQELAGLRLAAQQGLLERVRAEARRRLAALPEGEGYRDVLVETGVAAVEAMEGTRFELVLRPSDREKWGDGLPADVRTAVRRSAGRDVEVVLAEDTTDAAGGLLVRGAGGHQVADQTFEARLGRLWDDLREEVVRRIPSPLAEVE